MSLEQFLNFIVAHNAKIIEVLLGLTLLAILYLSIRMFLVAKDPSAADTATSVANLDLSGIEKTLKEIVEKAGQVPTAAAAASAGSGEDTQRLLTEIGNLKIELEAKQQQIEDMREMSSSPGDESAPVAAMSDEQKSKLESQIHELQAKLSEYEIISEDIADLSFYKEQNAKLQRELDSLKGGGGAVAAGPASSRIEPPEPIASSSSSELKDAQSVADELFAAAESPAAKPVAAFVDDDLMAEFAAAVEGQKGGSLEKKPATPAKTAPVTAEASAPAEEPGVDLGQMNIDKMLDEATQIKTDIPEEIDPETALGTTLDEDKLLQEAAALDGNQQNVTDEDKLLMSEFENFVKKNES